MATYIKYQLEDGSTVLVEVSAEQGGGVTKASNPVKDKDGNVIKPSDTKFEQAIDNVRGAVCVLLEKLRGLHEGPDEIEVKFGLKATGEAGVFAFGKVGAEANYEVTLKWSNKKE